jgi:cytochrome c5
MSGDPKPLSGSILRAGAILLGFGALLVVGQAAFRASHPATSSVQSPPPAAAVSQVTAGGFTLSSASIELPDDAPYPAGPGGDLMNANCTACHSASMALEQPALGKAQWAAEVDRMRKVYKATVADKDVPAIIAYLTALRPASAGQGGKRAAGSESSG